MRPSAPVSVMLPEDLRKKLQRQAEKRALKLSTTMRTLLEERLREIEEDEGLNRALLWQRAQAWESWERYKGGENAEVPWENIAAIFEVALGRKRSMRSRPPKTSKRTSRRKSRGY